jgi:hypothetical protein
LAERTGQLIEWNIINYKNGVNADESAMIGVVNKADAFRLKNAYTDFSVTTTVDLSMLFLSMPFAQGGVNGVVPPKTMEVTVTDYRGY